MTERPIVELGACGWVCSHASCCAFFVVLLVGFVMGLVMMLLVGLSDVDTISACRKRWFSLR